MIALTRFRLLSFLLAALTVTGCDAFTSVEARLERAEQGMEQGDYQRAVEQSKKALEKDPDNARARLMLAAASLQAGDLLTAEQEVAKAVERGADAAQLEPVRIDTLLALGRVQAAQDALDEATTLAAATREIYQGRILLARNEAAAAAAAFDRALQADPSSQEARLGQLDALILQSRFDDARAQAQSILDTWPDAGRAWLAIAGVDMQQARYEAAADALQQALENASALSVPQRIQARAGRVETLVLAGRLDDAIIAQQDLAKAAPGSPATLLTSARLALALGDPKTAVEALQRLVLGMPRQVGPRILLVSALLEQGSVEQALSEAGKLVGEFPGSDQARIVLSRAQLRAGRLDDAQATLRPLIDRQSPSIQAVSLAAQIELGAGRAGSGLQFLERGVESNPDSVGLKIELAAGYVAAGRAPEAVELLRSIPDGQASTQRDRLLVVAVAATRDAAAARAEIDRAIGANPDDATLLGLSAAYFASSGDHKLARDYFERALAASPGDRSATLGLARLDMADDKLDAATGRVQQVLEATPDDRAALGLMVEIATRRGLPGEVERWLQTARSADPAAVEPRLMLIRNALAEGDAAKADAVIAELDRFALRQAAVQVALGDVLAAGNRRADAQQRYLAAASLDAAMPQPHLGIARLQLSDNDTQAARASLEKALSLRPGWQPAAEALARLEAGEGRTAAALRIVADLKQRVPDSAAPWVLEGDVYRTARRPAEAVTAYDAAFSRQPSGTIAARLLGARRAAGLSNPERPLVQWLADTPGDVPARRALASHYLGVGSQDAAAAEYEKIVAAAPDDAVSLNNLAWLYSQRKDSRAMEMARKAFELAPDSASVGDTYAWILVQEGQLKKGLDIFQQVAEKATNNIEIQYHYAYALKADGQVERAREVLKAALASGGGGQAGEQARKLLAELGPR